MTNDTNPTPSAAPLPDFNDPRVKLVYDLLCEHDVSDKPKGDHWEGWIARRIVAGLASAAQPAAAPASEAPEGWRNKFAEAVYADLEAADNQDVPLEEYPARILKVLDSIVGPRHPTVIHWRNDAIQAGIAIAYKYCRDPESFQYLKQDLQALIFAAPKAAPAAQGDASPTIPKDIEMMATNRYRPVLSGVLAYKVVGGDGNRSLFSGTKDECQIVARKLTEAFLDGVHVALSTHPAAQSAQGDALTDSYVQQGNCT